MEYKSRDLFGDFQQVLALGKGVEIISISSGLFFLLLRMVCLERNFIFAVY